METPNQILQGLLLFSPTIEEDYNDVVKQVIDAYGVMINRFVQHLYDKELIESNDNNETFIVKNNRLHSFFVNRGIEFAYLGGKKIMTFNHNISSYKMHYSIDDNAIVFQNSVPGDGVKLISASFVIARFVKDILDITVDVDAAITVLQEAERVSDEALPIPEAVEDTDHHEEEHHYEEEQHHMQESHNYDEDRPF